MIRLSRFYLLLDERAIMRHIEQKFRSDISVFLSLCLSLCICLSHVFFFRLNEISRVPSSFVAVFSLRSVRSALLLDYLFRPLSPRGITAGDATATTPGPRAPPSSERRPLQPEHSCYKPLPRTHTHIIQTHFTLICDSSRRA